MQTKNMDATATWNKKASTWPSNNANKEHGPNNSATEKYRPNNTWRKNTYITQMKSMNPTRAWTYETWKKSLKQQGKRTLKAHKNTKKKVGPKCQLGPLYSYELKTTTLKICKLFFFKPNYHLL
jgi:hypothetical protein